MGIGQLTTLSGYKYGEVISAIQKEVRRSNERNALYWSMELEQEFHHHLWSRLSIICAEDIGIASMETSLFVAHCKEEYSRLRKIKNTGATMFLVNAVTAMCRAPKSRLSDDLNHVVHRRSIEDWMEIPDYALDKHTARGKRLGRGFDHWITEGAKLEDSPYLNKPAGFNPYEDERVEREKKNINFWDLGDPPPPTKNETTGKPTLF
jgi:replication-associated recombination protein RarA